MPRIWAPTPQPAAKPAPAKRPLPNVRPYGPSVNLRTILSAPAPSARRGGRAALVSPPARPSPSLASLQDLPGPKQSKAVRGGAILRRGTAAGQLQSLKPLNPSEKLAVGLLKNPQYLGSPQLSQYETFLHHPNAKVQRYIDQRPALKATHNQLISGQRVLTPAHNKALQNLDAAVGAQSKVLAKGGDVRAAAARVERAKVIAQGLGGLEIQHRGLGMLSDIVGNASQEAIGIGPGLIKYLISTGEDIRHGRLTTQENLAKALYHSYGRTIHDPGGQLRQDPLGFFTNIATPFTAGAGAIARGAELGSLAGEAGSMTARQAARSAAKTLLRPQPIESTLRHGGEEITRAPYKSALAGYLYKAQTALLNKRLAEGAARPEDTLLQAVGNRARSPINPESKFGRQQRAQAQLETEARAGFANRIQSGALGPTAPARIRNLIRRGQEPIPALRVGKRETRTAAEIQRDIVATKGAPGLKRMTTQLQRELEPFTNMMRAEAHAHVIHNLHQTWHANAETHDQVLARGGNPDHMVAIKPPPDKVPSPKRLMNEGHIYNYFDGTIRAGKKWEAANLDKVRYISKARWRSMLPFRPGKGTVEAVARNVDNLSQAVRAGRFAHPGYAGWAVQNGMIHLTQAGLSSGVNAYKLATEWPKLSDFAKGTLEGVVGGGVSRATRGEVAAGVGGKITQRLEKFRYGGEKFWHNIDDRPFRNMALIHELRHAGYHNAAQWEQLARDFVKGDPTARKDILSIGERGRDEAINYGEMVPAERNSLRRLLTAWGWTRGASTWTARFPLQHPIQARIAAELGRQGNQAVEQRYRAAGGMPPDYLRSVLPLGPASKISPLGIETSLLNPAETPGRVLPMGLGIGTERLSSELSPGPGAIMSALSGVNRYGQPYQGQAGRLTGPIKDMLKRFEPFGVYSQIGRKTPGTIKPGWQTALERYTGAPVTKFSDITKTAALGEKDYERSLARADQIQFRYNLDNQKIPQELAQMAKRGIHLPPQSVSAYKGDLVAKRAMDLYQLNYAHAHGAKSFKSLPAQNKFDAAINFLPHHSPFSPQDIAQLKQVGSGIKDDKQLEAFVNGLWHGTGIGGNIAHWKSTVRATKPAKLTPKQ